MTRHFLRRWVVKFIFPICAALALVSSHAVAMTPVSTTSTVIGSEAVVQLPQSALWEKNVNIRPGNGDVVTLNPPRFSWPACYLMTNNADTAQRIFQFQAGYDPAFNNVAVNVRTLSTMYNFLAPFTNSPVYWRVAYIGVVSGVTNFWITNSFSIASNALLWDRSMLANSNYLAQKMVHPYMMFNGSNVAAMSHWIQTNTNVFGCYKGYTGQMLANMITQANKTITNSWWPGSVPSSTVLDEGTWASYIAQVAFVWQMTGNPIYTSANQALYVCATNFVANHEPVADFISFQKFNTENLSLALGYDWLYQVMTPLQRQGVLNALDLRAQDILYGFGSFYVPQSYQYGNGAFAPTNYVFTPPFVHRYFSQLQGGTSHEIDNFNDSMVDALAGCQESTNCALLANLGLNYMIGCVNNSGACHSDDGQDEGHEYGGLHLAAALYAHMVAQTVFPEARFNLNPFWSNSADWWDRRLPVGFNSVHDPWGDANGVSANDNYWNQNSFGRMYTFFTGSGTVSQHWQAQSQILAGGSQDNQTTLPLLYYYPATPNPVLDPDSTGKLYTNSGWMISSTYGPNTTNCFNKGVGIIFQARPQGSEEGHSYFSDLSFEIWAYGANVTDAGAGMSGFGRVGWDHYSLLINGLGQCQPLGGPALPYYSKFIGFEDATNYTYVAADGTAAYPHTSFTPGGWMIPNQFANLETGAPLAFVQKVQRHILFMRRKYFVMYDDLQCLEPATFTWLYPVYQDTLQINTNSSNFCFAYTCTNQSGATVTVGVAHIAAPQSLELWDETGTNVAGNPITGENYWNQGGSWLPRAHTLWVNNATPATNFHFMTVIYPVPPGASLPQITRLDDYTAAITNGTEGDVISFDPNTKFPATMIINEPSISAAGAATDIVPTTNIVTAASSGGSQSVSTSVPLTPPTNLRIVVPVGSTLSSCFAANIVLPTGATSPVTNGLLGWWKFDSTNGATAVDSSGNGNSGTLTQFPDGNSFWEGGVINNALQFNGSDYVAMPAIANSSAFTVTCWVNPAAGINGYQFLLMNGSSFNGLCIYTGCHPCYFSSYITNISTAALTPGVWNFVAMTFNAGTVTFYINGNTADSSAYSGLSGMNPNLIGGEPYGDCLFGVLDNLKLFNRVLSTAEISQEYNCVSQ